MWQEFKAFAMRGNVLDMAVGIIIGTAFGAIAKSLVSDVIMPPLGLLVGKVDFASLFLVLHQGTPAGPYTTVAEAQKAGAVTINYGLFVNTVTNFLIVAFAVFLLIRSITKLQRQQETLTPAPTTKTCPYCFSTIALAATRCAHCTAELATS